MSCRDAPDDVGHLLSQGRDRQWRVLRGVGDAVAAAEVDLGAVVAVLVDDLGVQADQPAGRKKAGAIAFTVMFREASSFARLFVRPKIPAFELAYAT